LPPRAVPVRRQKSIGRSASGRLLYIDKDAVDRISGDDRALPRIADMLLDFPVLVVGTGVPSFKVEHVGAALRARGARGYWRVEVQPRPRAATGAPLVETLVGFPGLHIERIGSLGEL
jgi:hypothetical protein